MISVLLSILKILGIILLAVLGILLTMILLILFVPLRYSAAVKQDSRDEEALHARVKLNWLFHILNVLYAYPDAAYLRVRIFCFTVFRSDQEKKKKRTSGTKEEGQTSRKEEEKETAKKAEGNVDGKEKQEELEETGEKGPQMSETAEGNPEEEGNPEADEEPEPTRREFFKKLFGILKNIKYTIIQIYDKIKHILKNIKYYLKVIRSETFQKAFGVCSGQLIALLKRIRPRKLRGNLLIGTGDPASTGQVYAVYGILYPFIGNHISITPDFEQKIVEGELFLKGRITVFGLLRTAWKVYFNRDIRRVIKLLKREAA